MSNDTPTEVVPVESEPPAPELAGTFALYTTPDGGAVIVLEVGVAQGDMTGTHQVKIKPGTMRLLGALAKGDRSNVGLVRLASRLLRGGDGGA